jgi:hypothetical protein
VKLTRSLVVPALAAACALVAPVARAGTGCPDDPERCVERGASVPHTATVATSATRIVTPPAAPAVVATAHKSVAVSARKSASKPAHATPLPGTATPATPGMGMLLKLSGGTGGDVSWYPSRPADNTGASWVL